MSWRPRARAPDAAPALSGTLPMIRRPARAQHLAERSWELFPSWSVSAECSRLRRGGNAGSPITMAARDCASWVKDQPRRLLASVDGLALKELPDAETCCGFGGTFCVKYPDISDKMVSDKAADIAATGAEAVLAGDLGCP